MTETYLTGMDTEEGRRAIAEVLLALFRLWQLEADEQAKLLGMEEAESLWQGAALPNDNEVLERAGMLLGIDRALKQQFAEQPMMQERWVSLPNIWLKGKAPIEKMLEGIEGIRELYEVFKQNPPGNDE